jgi:hypothetical protein
LQKDLSDCSLCPPISSASNDEETEELEEEYSRQSMDRSNDREHLDAPRVVQCDEDEIEVVESYSTDLCRSTAELVRGTI